ncbi:MAG: hypothetical protein AB1673_13785 [Actinomycetota bacterium]
MSGVIGIFGITALTGLIALLFGWNASSSGRVENKHDDQSQLLAGFRFAGSFYARLGVVLVIVGVVGMTVSALLSLAT